MMNKKKKKTKFDLQLFVFVFYKTNHKKKILHLPFVQVSKRFCLKFTFSIKKIWKKTKKKFQQKTSFALNASIDKLISHYKIT